jgi:1,2-diacylglycerol 3-alpha-glucosyltransferase
MNHYPPTNCRRVALLTPRYAPAIGGLEKHVQYLAQGIEDLYLNSETQTELEVFTLDPSVKSPTFEICNKVVVRRFPVRKAGNVDLFAPELIKWVAKHAHKYDLIHVQSYHTPLALQAAWLSLKTGLPLVITPHYHGTGHSPLRAALHIPYRLAGHFIMRQARQVIAVSQVEKDLLKQHFGAGLSVQVVPNGVVLPTSAPHTHTADLGLISIDADTDADNEKAKKTHLLSVGRLEKYKQVDKLILAMRHLPQNYELTIVGEGEDRARLEKLIESCGLQSKINLIGRVQDARLEALYRRSDLFITLSRHEAFGLTLLEAAISGTAVLASNIAAHAEVMCYLPDGYCRLVEKEISPSHLARGIQAYPYQAKSGLSRENNLVANSKWNLPTWLQMAERTVRLYEDVLTPPNKVHDLSNSGSQTQEVGIL